MAYKLIDAAHTRWPDANAPHLVALSVPASSSITENSSHDPSTSPRPNPANQPKRTSPETTCIESCSCLKRGFW
jgi:hypothetical protein